MRRQIHRLAACMIVLALLLTFCPMIGSASAGTNLLPNAVDGKEGPLSAGSQILRAPQAMSEGTGSIVVSLTVSGCEEAESKTFEFILIGPDGSSSYFTITGSGTYTLSNLAPGEYYLRETQSSAEVYGYILSSPGLTTVTVRAGESSNVSLSNTYTVDPNASDTPPAGSLTLTSTVSGGGAEAANLTFTVTIVGPDGYSNAVSLTGDDSVTLDNLTPGEYTIDVEDVGGGSFEVYFSRSVTVDPGQNAVDHFSYSYEPAPTPELTPEPTPALTPEPIPEPTPTPEPASTPEPTPSLTPEATPEITPTPSPTPTEIAEVPTTPVPIPTGTMEPTPTPTATVTPTQTPAPSSTLSPEGTPTPEHSPTPTPTVTPEPDVSVYIDDRDEYIELPVRLLDEIESVEDAVEAVQVLIGRLTPEQKVSHTAIDIATLYAERAASKTAVVEPDDNDEIWINAELLHRVDSTVKEAAGLVRDELEDSGVDVDRKLPKTVILYLGDRTSFVAKVDPDVLTTDVDKIRVETDRFAITFKLDDLAADLDEILRFRAEEVGYTGKPSSQAGAQAQLFAMATSKTASTGKVAVQLTMPEEGITNPITLSIQAGYHETLYETMLLNDEATPSKYNPATVTIDGKTTTSGTYTTDTNEVDFSDIADKSEEMQAAIKNLASKGVLVGTAKNTFSPDKTITRAEIASLMVKVLGLVDEKAEPTYTDVTKVDWFYTAAASCQKARLMNGYGDNKFHGKETITKAQILVTSGNVLLEYMNYEVPSNPDLYLSRFRDGVPSWGRDTIALSAQENLVIYRTDGMFLGNSGMTRGDAAIIINRLFRRIW